MLKNRLIPTIILKNDLVVQSFNFKDYLPIGKIDAVIEFFNNWDVDEIIVIDIDASKEKRIIKTELIERIAKNCFVPLAVGGGIRNEDHLRRLLAVGIEKIVINKIIFDNPNFINSIASKYGKQFIVASLDAKLVDDDYYVFIDNGSCSTKMNVREASKMVEESGAGEIFINSIDRDGMMAGYDLNLAKEVRKHVNLPITFLGGAGSANDMRDLIKNVGIIGAAAGSFFVFNGIYRAVLISYTRP